MIANPNRGEVALVINGEPHILRLTLGALAALEAGLATDSLPQLIERLGCAEITSNDIVAVLNAGLYGAGHHGLDIAQCVIDGGARAAASAARQLIITGIGDAL